jgi:hypothetical protein
MVTEEPDRRSGDDVRLFSESDPDTESSDVVRFSDVKDAEPGQHEKT